MKVKKAILALALVMALGVVGASQLLASSSRSSISTTIVVDEQTGSSTRQCTTSGPNPNDYKGPDAITNAIGDASDGWTINVCPGKYSAFVVDKQVNIIGTSVTATTAAQCLTPATVPATDKTKYAVIDGGGSGNAIEVDGTDGVKVKNLTIQNAEYGIHTDNSTTGFAVETSVIQNNTIGVGLNGDIWDHGTPGDTTDDNPEKVKSNCIRRNNLPGGYSGSGVLTLGDLNAGKILMNTFFRNNNSGDGGAINLIGGTVQSVMITTNTGNADANFVSATGTDGLIISGNITTGILGGAVWLDGGNDNAQVTANTFANGHDDGIAFGDNGVGNTNDHVLVFGNRVTGNATDGIDTRTDGALAGSSIANNIVQTNGINGIALIHDTNEFNFVTGNTVSGNGTDPSDNCVDTDKATYHNTWFSNGADCKP
jgi:hypothetical protein